MISREEIASLLRSLPDAAVLADIYEGLEVPTLTDYYLQRWPEDWDKSLPPEMVDGRTLIPIFKDGDAYSIYCIEPQSGKFFDLDIESPWPPDGEFDSCLDFKRFLYRIVTEDKSDDVKHGIGAALGIAKH